jgi:hypothetical protein
MTDDLTTTRRAWHAVGELVLAGPQYREHGTIRLRVVPGGFAQVAGPLRVEGAELVATGCGCRCAVRSGRWATPSGVVAGAPQGLYGAHADLGPDDEASAHAAAAAQLGDWLARGDAGLRAFAPGVEPVLWPEHFDLAITLDEVNYGVSLGDGGHAAPYAYVGPWTPRTGPFWNASFGALRPATELPDADAVAAFFAEGCGAAS